MSGHILPVDVIGRFVMDDEIKIRADVKWTMNGGTRNHLKENHSHADKRLFFLKLGECGLEYFVRVTYYTLFVYIFILYLFFKFIFKKISLFRFPTEAPMVDCPPNYNRSATTLFGEYRKLRD